jgi:hypothetical protein
VLFVVDMDDISEVYADMSVEPVTSVFSFESDILFVNFVCGLIWNANKITEGITSVTIMAIKLKSTTGSSKLTWIKMKIQCNMKAVIPRMVI